MFLLSVTRIKMANPKEMDIINSAKKITEQFCNYKSKSKFLLDSKLEENSCRISLNQVLAVEYNVSDMILPIGQGQEEIEQQYIQNAMFNFPQQSFNESQCSITIENYKLRIYSALDPTKVFFELNVDEISCIIRNEKPKNASSNKMVWLKINGRKIINETEHARIIIINK